jgi:hypothetical protein
MASLALAMTVTFPASFRDAPLGAGPESIFAAVAVARWISGFALTRAPE